MTQAIGRLVALPFDDVALVFNGEIYNHRELRRQLGSTTPDDVPPAARMAIEMLFEHIDDLRGRAEAVEAEIIAWHQASETSKRLAGVPGIGPLTASALVAWRASSSAPPSGVGRECHR